MKTMKKNKLILLNKKSINKNILYNKIINIRCKN